MIPAMKNQPPSVDSLVQAVSMVHVQCCLRQCSKFLCPISFRFNCASDECFHFTQKLQTSMSASIRDPLLFSARFSFNDSDE